MQRTPTLEERLQPRFIAPKGAPTFKKCPRTRDSIAPVDKHAKNADPGGAASAAIFRTLDKLEGLVLVESSLQGTRPFTRLAGRSK
jgi:hypothetical protein